MESRSLVLQFPGSSGFVGHRAVELIWAHGNGCLLLGTVKKKKREEAKRKRKKQSVEKNKKLCD